MKKVVVTVLAFIAFCLVSSGWAAPVPSTINYQGYLSDDNGEALQDGDYEITLRIYNVLTGGTALWAETWTGANLIPVTRGRFSVNMGSITSFESAGLGFDEQYYLEIQLGSNAPFSPRQAFTSVPYAMHATYAGGIPLPVGGVVGTVDEQTLSNKTLSGAAIEASTIDNTVIGATSAAAGTFTDLSVTGDLTVDGVILGRATIDGAEKTADYTMTDTDDIVLVDTSAQDVTINLPAAAGNSGRTYTIKLNTGGNLLTILPDGTETIDGRANLTLQKEGTAVRMVSDDADWQIVGEVGYATFHRDASDQDQGVDLGNSYDQVILDDLIVDGSECIGYDCIPDEAFDFDALVLKENNLRIYFQDTSVSASFPTNDWRITVNDSIDGGRNYFSIDDVDGGLSGLLIEAGGNVGIGRSDAPRGKLDVHVAAAPNNVGLLVTDDGKVGIGTETPDEPFEIEFGPDIDVEFGQGTTNPNVTFIALRSPNGTKYYITVDDAGNLTASTTRP
jgi:hypothetical protein